MLKQYRNLLTHGSAEARERLTDALAALAEFDPQFAMNQPVTLRTVGHWLVGSGHRRLRVLLDCIPALWRAMVVAEGLLGERPQPSTPPHDTPH